MRIKSLTAAAAALAMVAAPVAASANPASPLSVSGSVRASSSKGSSKIAGGNGFIIAFVLAAMFAAALVLPDSLEDSPSSR